MLIDDVVPELLAGRLEAAPQLRIGVTAAGVLTPSEARIDPSWTASYAERAVRAFNPRPGAWFAMEGNRFRVRETSFSDESVTPGVIAPFNGQAVLGLVGGSLSIDMIQPAGRQPMTGTAWLNGRRGAGGRVDAAPE